MLFGFAFNKSHKLALSKYWFTVASVEFGALLDCLGERYRFFFSHSLLSH